MTPKKIIQLIEDKRLKEFDKEILNQTPDSKSMILGYLQENFSKGDLYIIQLFDCFSDSIDDYIVIECLKLLSKEIEY